MQLRDNTRYKQAELDGIPNVVKSVADKTLLQLEREGLLVFPPVVSHSNGLTEDQMILQHVNSEYRTSNVMGFLGHGQERLTIASRFSSGAKDFFFEYLLAQIFDFPSVVALDSDVGRDRQLLQIVQFMFPQYLKSAMRKGLFKAYVNRQYNDLTVKGVIDIARHIQVNTPFIGKIASNQREFSFDNQLMELVRHTIELLKQMRYGEMILQPVSAEVRAVINATPGYQSASRRKVIEVNEKQPVRHAYYAEYQALQRLCLFILKNRKQALGGSTQHVRGILFDGAWLWEEYVNQLIHGAFFHPMNKRKSGAQKLFSTLSGSKVGLIYPDFISRCAHPRVIADTKYKPCANIGNRDYLQLLAYMFRFDAKRGFYLYPEQDQQEALVLQLNQGSTYEQDVIGREGVDVTKLGLRIPVVTPELGYDDFVSLMHVSEQSFVDRLLAATN
ncbi:McrC family protein [Lacticaseibacillus kribbianus]|uniref:McrC family protein n=1 Tax=Lacticaseibacillus kribbianus TaxID=2926292 RepID=UPI001CD4A96F|nr:McrC family protein [Lacticaseibacillus kribbianus]